MKRNNNKPRANVLRRAEDASTKLTKTTYKALRQMVQRIPEGLRDRL